MSRPGEWGNRADVSARLAGFQALTDTSITHLEVDALLVELLARVREILEVDTAAVLLLDGESGDLVATAACGIEDEVRQGVRVPVGVGFAGRIAATRAPVRLDQVDSTTVTNPILWEKGIRVMLGVPLLRGDDVFGVLHVGRLDRRRFDDHDVALLRVVADRVASAVQTRQLAIERAATGLLERSLLPTKLPRLHGLDLATRYAAAEGLAVGGDWYDIFTVPSGQLWIVVGDVAGHGLRAAVVMGRIRSALRAYALVDRSPSHVLDLVDRKVNHFEIGTMATVACAVMDPPYDSMTLALAGHPPPMLLAPCRAAALVEAPVGPPIGLNIAISPRSSVTVSLPADAVVALYTDGLVERRGEALDIGFERLQAAMSQNTADRVAGEIMRRVIGDSVPRDDIALVVIRRTDVVSDEAGSDAN